MQSRNGNDVHILALAGSFRKGSLNQALIRAARELTPDHVQIDDFDLRGVPFYDGDLEAAGDPVRGSPRRAMVRQLTGEALC